MTSDEWEVVCLHLDQGWKGELDAERRAVYATFLMKMPFEVVMTVLHRLAETGNPWLPTVPELMKGCRDLTEPVTPSWTETWDLIEQVMKKPEKLAEVDETVRAFIEREGLRKLQMAPFYDPDKGDMRIYQLQQRWEEFVDVHQARVRSQRALQAAGMPEIGNGASRALESGS